MRQNQSGKRKVVVVISERDGKTLPGVFRNEGDALGFIRRNLAPQTELYADEAASWNELHARYTLHQEAYSLPDEVYTNNAESYFSRMRRAERSGTITTSPALIFFASRKRAHGVRIIGKTLTASRLTAS